MVTHFHIIAKYRRTQLFLNPRYCSARWRIKTTVSAIICVGVRVELGYDETLLFGHDKLSRKETIYVCDIGRCRRIEGRPGCSNFVTNEVGWTRFNGTQGNPVALRVPQLRAVPMPQFRVMVFNTIVVVSKSAFWPTLLALQQVYNQPYHRGTRIGHAEQYLPKFWILLSECQSTEYTN